MSGPVLMEIVPPFFVDESGDIQPFRRLADAEIDVEAIDVRDGLYDFFDSTGRPLDAEIYEDVVYGRIFGWLRSKVEQVRLSPRPGAAPEPDLLATKIADALRPSISRHGNERVGMTESELEDADLAKLIDVFVLFELGPDDA